MVLFPPSKIVLFPPYIGCPKTWEFSDEFYIVFVKNVVIPYFKSHYIILSELEFIL